MGIAPYKDDLISFICNHFVGVDILGHPQQNNSFALERAAEDDRPYKADGNDGVNFNYTPKTQKSLHRAIGSMERSLFFNYT